MLGGVQRVHIVQKWHDEVVFRFSEHARSDRDLRLSMSAFMGDVLKVDAFLKALGTYMAALSRVVRAATSFYWAAQEERSATGAGEEDVEAAVAALVHGKAEDWQVSLDEVSNVLELTDAAQPASGGLSLAGTRVSGSIGIVGAPTGSTAAGSGAGVSPVRPRPAADPGGRARRGPDLAGSDGEDMGPNRVPVPLDTDAGDSDMLSPPEVLAAVLTGRRPSAGPHSGWGGQQGRGVPLAVRGAASGRTVSENIAAGERPGAQDPTDSVFAAYSENVQDSKSRHDVQSKLMRDEICAQSIPSLTQILCQTQPMLCSRSIL